MEQHQFKCLIIEDEPIASEILKEYIEQVPFLSLEGICSDALLAYQVLQQSQIDVIFLDIHLPKLKGLDFLKSLEHRPQTILTTAYSNYAIEAFSENVLDYLLKPIAFPRFLKAVNKLKNPEISLSTNNTVSSKSRVYRFFTINKKKVKIYFDEVLYLESLKDYTRIITAHQRHLVRAQIGELVPFFTPHHFLRIHRSFMINLNQLTAFSAVEVEIGDTQLPIGRTYRQQVSHALEKMA